jgi:DNA repair protein RecO (recombination protein O)
VVLQVHRYSDTSKILRLLTRQHGPVSVIARGALRPRSRLSGLLELFAEGNATFYLKRNRDLHTLSDFELIRERQTLGLDMTRFSGASVLCELVLRIAPREADEYLFDSLIASLDRLLLANDEIAGSVALAGIWELVSLLGFAPSVDVCLDCGRALPADESARFDVQAGGLRCSTCPAVGRVLKAADVAVLRALVAGSASETRASGIQSTLLVEFVQYHASEGSRIRSLDFLKAPLP